MTLQVARARPSGGRWCVSRRGGDRCRPDAVAVRARSGVVCDTVAAAQSSVSWCRREPAWCGRRATWEGSVGRSCRPTRALGGRCPRATSIGRHRAVERSYLRTEERSERRDYRTTRPHTLSCGVDGRHQRAVALNQCRMLPRRGGTPGAPVMPAIFEPGGLATAVADGKQVDREGGPEC
jgi:hypothetical protein